MKDTHTSSQINKSQYSEIVINHMQSINTEKRPAMKCKLVLYLAPGRSLTVLPWTGQVMDVRDRQFDDNSFDVAINKGLFISHQRPE